MTDRATGSYTRDRLVSRAAFLAVLLAAFSAFASKNEISGYAIVAPHGEYYWSTPSATALSAATPAKSAGTTTALKEIDFTHANNKLTYDGPMTQDFMVTITVSMTKASGGSTLGHVHIAKNGTEVTGLEVRRTLANTSDEGALALVGTLELATSDYVEVFLETDNGDDLTIQTGVVTVEAAD